LCGAHSLVCITHNAVIEHLQLFSNFTQAIFNISRIVIVRCAQPFTHHAWCSDWTPSTVFHVAWYTTHCTHRILSINCTLYLSLWLRNVRLLAPIGHKAVARLFSILHLLFYFSSTKRMCWLYLKKSLDWSYKKCSMTT